MTTLKATQNETVEIRSPDDDTSDLGGVLRITWWDRHGLEIELGEALGRLKITRLETEGGKFSVTVERDW